MNTPRHTQQPSLTASDSKSIRRVIFIRNAIGNLGGIQSVIDNLAAYFKREGLVVSYVSLFPPIMPPPIEGDVFVVNKFHPYTSENRLARQYPGILSIKYTTKRALTPWWRRWRTRRFRRFTMRLDAHDAVIFAEAGAALLLRASDFPKGRNRPLILTQFHGSIGMLGILSYKDELNAAQALSTGLLALCTSDAADFAQFFKKPVSIMPNAVPEQHISMKREAPLSRTHRLVYAGRLEPDKGVDLAIRAFTHIAVPNWEFHIYGSGVISDQLEELANQGAAASHIHFHGYISDVGSAYMHADLAVLASATEGVPMSVLEAARYGVPTVGTASSSGMSELLEHGGYFIQHRSVDGVSQALLSAMADDELRARKGEEAAAYSSQFSIDVIGPSWLQVFADHSVKSLETVTPEH